MLLLLAACTPSTLSLGDPSERPSRRPDTGDDTDVEHIGDTGPADTDTAPPDTGDSEEEAGKEAVFTLDTLHTIALTIGRAGRASLGADPYTYVAADLTFDGEEYPNVGVRLKGRLGSFRSLDGKAALKIDLLEMGETDKLHGIEKLNVNNMVQDCAKVHELAAYEIHRMTGTPAPRIGYAEVTIDGEPYGLYSLVEDYDDEFLQDNFADPTGNLYDGDYKLWPGGNYTLLDFNADTQGFFLLDEGTDVGLADIQAVTTAVGGGLRALADVVDLDQHATFLAVSAWTGHYDSYSYYSNNYRVYFDPARGGRAILLPWDPDWAFYSATNVNAPYGVLSQLCLADAGCRAAVSAEIDTLSATIPGSALETDLQTAIDLIEPALQRDPRLESSLRDIRSCQADLFDWFDRRGAELDAAGL